MGLNPAKATLIIKHLKYILKLVICLLSIGSNLSAATYVVTSGSVQDILTNAGYPHWYTGVNLTPGAYLVEVDLFEAALPNADLSNATLIDAILAFADLTYADLEGANLTNARIASTDFSDASLIGANLYNTSAREAIWTNANLYGASLPDGYDQTWFEAQGAIFVYMLPESSSYALLFGGLALGLVALRRR